MIHACTGSRNARLPHCRPAKDITFENFVKWRSEQYAATWLRQLELHAFPVLGDVSVANVDLAAVCRVLDPIWNSRPRTAALVRANIEAVLNFACAEGTRTTDNSARWDLLRHVLPARSGARIGGHFRALPYNGVADLMNRLCSETTIAAQCLRFTILTAARTNEAISCRWSDIDFARQTRVVDILKGGGAIWQHTVPLSTQAIALLRSLLPDGQPISEFVFPARNRPEHLGTSAMLDLLQRIGWRGRTTTHGLRAAFKTWATERTNYPREVIELCLSHVQRDPLDRAYQRGDILEKRRSLMQDWSDFCTTASGTSVGNVVLLRA